jgi:hypothetical protein
VINIAAAKCGIAASKENAEKELDARHIQSRKKICHQADMYRKMEFLCAILAT